MKFMWFMRLLLWTLSFFLLVTPAEAGPLAAAISLVAGLFKVGGIIGVLIKAAISIAINIGMSLIQKAMQKKQKQPGIQGQIQVGGDTPLSIILGWYATAGHLEYVNTWGSRDSDTPNAYLVQVISISDLPVNAMTGIFVNGERCTLDVDRPHPVNGIPIHEYRKDDRDNLWIRFYDGTQTEADPYLLDKFSTKPDRPWTSDQIGYGVAYVIVTARLERSLFTGVPQCRFEIEGARLYDRRKDSTAGGVGGQRASDPTTWEYSACPVVMIENILRGLYYGDQWVFGLQRLSPNRLPAASWMAAANECDRLVDTTTGQEAQFRAGLEVRVDTEPFDVIESLLKSCNGRMAEIGGIYKVHVGSPSLPVYAFTDDDIVITEGQDFTPFPGLEDTYNGIHATYPEPDEAWETKDAPPRYNETYEESDMDRRLIADVVFECVPYPDQVQRLMKPMIEEERRFRRHAITLPPEAWLLEPAVDTVSWTSTRNGYVNKSFLVVSIDGPPGMNQLVSLREVDPSDYDWNAATETMPSSTGFLGTMIPPPQPFLDWIVEPYIIEDATSGHQRPGIQLFWDGDQDDVQAVTFEVRLYLNPGEIVYRGRADNVVVGNIVIGQNLLPNTEYEVRAKYVPFSARDTLWSDWIYVKTNNILIGTLDIYDNAITREKIIAGAVDANILADEAVTSLKIAADAVTAAKIATGSVLSDKLAANAVTSEKLADAAVIARNLADGTITATKFAAGLVPVEVVDVLPTSGNFEGRQAFLTTDGKLYTYHQGAWSASDFDIPPGSITAVEIADGTITATEIANNAITSDKIIANAITANKIAANTITALQIAANTITAGQIAANTVTAAQIAANTITAGQIAAGAITATEIAAGAITTAKLAAGSVTADILAVGTGGNWLDNSDMSAGIADWSFNAVGPVTLSVRTDNYAPIGGALEIHTLSGGAAGNYGYVYAGDASRNIRYFPVVAGKKYQFSVYCYMHRTTNFGMIRWFDVNGALLLDSGLPQFGPDNGNPNYSLGAYNRPFVIATAPAGAVKAVVIMGINPKIVGQADCYGWFVRPFFAEAGDNQTEPSPWSSSGVTLISGGHILANTITGSNIAADTLTAANIAAGAITASELAANSVTAVSIAAGTITGAKIAANTITGDKIVANSITVKQMLVTDFSNLCADPYMQSSASWYQVNPGFNFGVSAGAGYNGMSTFVDATNVPPNYNMMGEAIPVAVGDSFNIVGIVQRFGTGTLVLYGYYINADQSAIVGGAPAVAWSSADPGGYLRKNFTVPPAPAGAAYLRYYFVGHSTDVIVGTYRIGFLGVYRKANAELIVDGSITAAKITASKIDAGQILINGTLITDIIATNAVSDVGAYSNYNDQGPFTTNSEFNIGQINLNLPAGTKQLMTMYVRVTDSLGGIRGTFRIRQNSAAGTILAEWDSDEAFSSQGDQHKSTTFITSVPTSSFVLTLTPYGGTPRFNIRQIQLAIVSLKR